MNTAVEKDVVEKDVATLQAELRQLREDFSSVAQTLRDLARHGTAGVQDDLAGAANSAGRLWTGAKDKAESIAGEIERHPMGAAIAAFLAGIVLGLLFTGRQK